MPTPTNTNGFTLSKFKQEPSLKLALIFVNFSEKVAVQLVYIHKPRQHSYIMKKNVLFLSAIKDISSYCKEFYKKLWHLMRENS